MIFFRAIGIVFLVWLMGSMWFINQIKLTEPDNIETADAIIVLTGSKGRIDAGIKLLLEKKAKVLFVSGVGKKAVLGDLSKYLLSFSPQDIEPLKESIVLGYSANSTEENAIETAEWVQQHNYKKIILVTSNYHMPRSLLLLGFTMPNVEITPYPVIKSKQYWQHISTVKLVFLEYNKFLFSYINAYFELDK